MQSADDNQPVPAAQQSRFKKPKKQVGVPTLIGAIIVVAVAAFVGGMRADPLLAWLQSSSGQNTTLPSQLDFGSVQQVYDKLKNEFDGPLDTNKLIDGAKKGLVDAAGDPYSVYFTDAEAKQFQNSLDGKFSGIGAELDKKDGNLIVRATLDDSPARKAGLMADDIIAKVNDQDASKWSIDEAVSKIRGDKGTTVKLTIVRGQQLKEVPIVRAEIVNPSVKHEILSGEIGYIRMSRFADDTYTLMQNAATEFKQKNVKGVILDVRGNGGGYLNAAQQVSSLWLQQGEPIVQERRGDKVVDTLKATGNPLLKGIKTVVLIDDASASASEIVAGALNDYDVATLVGQKTFGKGSVQQLLDIPSGGQLKVTIAKWFTPKGVNISKEGIKPDVEVGITSEDITGGRDPQKDKALELLKK
ncbi:MAG TPA: S41 family peptidase [Candidatus Saccharimonadales bacterium]|nr:S41 family peptidase [Candidatus Saccharimonadales bacterium]